jgi:Protein of unknown function (DUF4242)
LIGAPAGDYIAAMPDRQIYLVERYLPGIRHEQLRELAARLQEAAAAARANGTPVRYLDSTFVPQEESCFCRLEAPSVEAAARVNQVASAPYARITAAVALESG